MMNIVIPMAGEGKRFSEQGYSVHKPAIPTVNRRTGETCPMVVCAASDLPDVEDGGSNIIYIDRTFHKDDGVETEIKKHYPLSHFITVEQLTEGQACTCLLAKEKINNEEPLLIAGCDNGMDFNSVRLKQILNECDVLVFTYRNHESVCEHPNSYGWVAVKEENKIEYLSIKKALSVHPMNDHAIVATFWFRQGNIFVEAAEKMIRCNDRIRGEFYVDQVIKYAIELGYDARVFEIERYIGWGTPKDFEEYSKTISYWTEFVQSDQFLPGNKR